MNHEYVGFFEALGEVRTNNVDNTQFPYFEPNSRYMVVRWNHMDYVINKMGQPMLVTMGTEPFTYMCSNDKGVTDLFVDIVSEINGWKTTKEMIEEIS